MHLQKSVPIQTRQAAKWVWVIRVERLYSQILLITTTVMVLILYALLILLHLLLVVDVNLNIPASVSNSKDMHFFRLYVLFCLVKTYPKFR